MELRFLDFKKRALKTTQGITFAAIFQSFPKGSRQKKKKKKRPIPSMGQV